MSIYAIIAEYNPLHKGHLYQINKIKSMDPDASIIVILSTFFVQRGEPSFLDPKLKTKAALSNGVDLVLSLPTIYSLQSAENFAYGALSILNQIKEIDYLVFGTETDLSSLKKLADFQIQMAKLLAEKRIEFMNQGDNFNQAFIKAIHFHGEKSNLFFDENLFRSNNILALEYLKSLRRLKSDIKPISIKRSGHHYNDDQIHAEKFASATAIRNLFFEDPKKVIGQLPKDSFQGIKDSRYIENKTIYDLIKFQLIKNIDLSNITGYEKGLTAHLYKSLKLSENYEVFLQKAATKRYRKSRIKRFIINSLLDNTSSFIDHSVSQKPEWVRVLGFTKKGQGILHHAKDNELIFLTQYKQYQNLSPFGKMQFQKEIESCNLYYFNSQPVDDYYRWTPIVKKD